MDAILNDILNGEYHARQNFPKTSVYFHASFRYNNNAKGVCAMTQYEQMDLLLEQNKGMIRPAPVLDVGITKTVFCRYVKELIDLGVTDAQTPFGHTVPVYDMEQTVCDLVRSRNKIEIQALQGALKQYTRHKEKNLRKLMQYAAAFHVGKTVRQYLEILL